MIDEAALQELYGKLIYAVPAAIIAALIWLITWVAQRQIKRIDGHDIDIKKFSSDISKLHEAYQMIDMQLSQQKSDAKNDIIRLEGDMEDREARILQLMEYSEKNTKKYMDLVSEHLAILTTYIKKE